MQAVQHTRKFSNFNQSLSKVLERLVQKGLLRPLINVKPLSLKCLGYDPNSYFNFHQAIGHPTDTYICLKHEIQNLIDFKKITDPEKSNPNPNTKTNSFLNYPNVPPPAVIVTSSGISKVESTDASKNEEKSKKPAALSYLPREIKKEVIEEVTEEMQGQLLFLPPEGELS